MNDLLNTIQCMDIFDLCGGLEDNSIDMILADLPYGITACEWDNVIPFEPMWEQFKRVIKPRGAVVLTASQPFTSQLVMSNLEWFRYEWVWEKAISTQFLDANRRPLKRHEVVLIFSDKQTKYYPQFSIGKPYNTNPKASPTGIYHSHYRVPTVNSGERFPTTIIKYNNERGIHLTQKPVALFEYLIRTYTQPGEIVFDPCVGSGTTAIAARNTGRNYICGDSSEEYVTVARARLAKPFTPNMFIEAPEDDKPEQLEMDW